MTVEDSTDKGKFILKNWVVGLAQRKGKLLPMRTQKFIRAISVHECSVWPSDLLPIPSAPTSYAIRQLLTARASNPFAPGPRAAPRRRCASIARVPGAPSPTL
jgi:hypothetical protein